MELVVLYHVAQLATALCFFFTYCMIRCNHQPKEQKMFTFQSVREAAQAINPDVTDEMVYTMLEEIEEAAQVIIEEGSES